MKLNNLSIKDVQAATQLAKAQEKLADQYNIITHSYTEIFTLISKAGCKHIYPDPTIEHFSNQASLIISS